MRSRGFAGLLRAWTSKSRLRTHNLAPLSGIRRILAGSDRVVSHNPGQVFTSPLPALYCRRRIANPAKHNSLPTPFVTLWMADGTMPLVSSRAVSLTFYVFSLLLFRWNSFRATLGAAFSVNCCHSDNTLDVAKVWLEILGVTPARGAAEVCNL